MIGAAATAGDGGRFVHDHGLAALRELDRGGKAGEAGADDVDGARHQMNAYRRMIQASRARDTLTRSRGALQPRAIMPSRIDAVDLAHDPRRLHRAARAASP